MGSAPTDVDSLAKTAGSIADHAMRSAYVRHTLLSMEVEQVADLLTLVMAGAEARRAGHGELLQSISLALASDSCDEVRLAVASLLAARQQVELARAFIREEVEEEAETQRVPDFGKGRILTLGERKALARRNDRDTIARVLRDPHPDVIRIVLGNPGLTETHVIRLVSRRPASREVQREVFNSARWVVRYPVKVALLLNPYTPLDVGLQLAPLLTQPDLKRAGAAQDLREDLREVCKRLIGSTADTVLH